MTKSGFTAKKIAVLAVFSALSLITFLIENLFPQMFIPGAKMGLANIFSTAALIIYSPVEGFAVVGVRTLLGAIIVGNVSALMYSFTGGMVSMAVSSILIYVFYPKISLLAVSVTAAVAHNICQCLVFTALSRTAIVFSYMPYLALLGIIAGAIVGLTLMIIFKKVPLSVFEKAVNYRSENKGKL